MVLERTAQRDIDTRNISPELIKNLPDTARGIMKLGPVYRGAMKEISTKLENIDHEFQTLYDHNPIHHIQCRLKSTKSIIEKLERKNIPVTVENSRNEVLDIAGIRVICNYLDDIYVLTELLIAQEDVELVSTHNYIRYPKPNGYRSLHLIVKVPVYLSSGAEKVPVEIQIRTIAMDMWASLEHEMRYKAEAQVSPLAAGRLKACADSLAEADREMQDIYKQCLNERSPLDGRRRAAYIKAEF